MRGARRTLSLAGNLRAVGVRGIVGSLKGVAVETLVHPFSRSNPRSDYFIECGSQPPEFDDRREPVSATAAATLLGIREFLDAMPELAERRARLQVVGRRHPRPVRRALAVTLVGTQTAGARRAASRAGRGLRPVGHRPERDGRFVGRVSARGVEPGPADSIEVGCPRHHPTAASYSAW
jgi:hypothetical protein